MAPVPARTSSVKRLKVLFEERYGLGPHPATKPSKPDLETILPDAPSVVPHFCFAFDIDGVLDGVDEALPGATKCLQFLMANRIPFILLTNRAGEPEASHVYRLSRQLSVKLPVEIYVQSHTPCRNLLPTYQNEFVLVVGGQGNACRSVAQGYGFLDAITVADLVSSFPSLSRFAPLAEHFPEKQRRKLTVMPKIAAVFFWQNSRDWCLDIQLALDLALSKDGVLGTVSALNGRADLPNCGYQQDGQPAFYFTNSDLAWAHAAAPSKLGQGAFAHALRAVWHAATDGRAAFQATVLGKPSQATFAYGEQVLRDRRARLAAEQDASVPVPPLTTVYMIGDNPASDIRGANEYVSAWETTWHSVLVETGLHVAGEVPTYEPTFTVPGVEDAVREVLRREGHPGKL